MSQEKTVKAWAIIDGTKIMHWPNSWVAIEQCEIFPSRQCALDAHAIWEKNGQSCRVAPVTITYKVGE
jgi:hypothetical protein